MATEDHFWINFCNGVDRPDLIARYGFGSGRFGLPPQDDSLRAEIACIFKMKSAAEWNTWFNENNVAGSDVFNSMNEVMAHPQVRARGMVPEFGPPEPRVLADAIRWAHDDSRPGDTARWPTLGGDTEDVLERWLS
jgi:crotonobetainyl-CoA:carnitine CoA-transferase CaiB-like acyl-CoA transferase